MRIAKRIATFAAAALFVALMLPGAAWGYVERGPSSTVDPALELKGCEWCHQTSQPYSKRSGPHGGYTSTSSGCAVCHTLHAATGPQLLPKMTSTATCLSCHDGTGGFGPYGTIKARTGADATSGHRAITGATNVVPGGAADTGGARIEVAYNGEGGNLGCVDCHSPHASQVVADFSGERMRVDWLNTGNTSGSRLLKQRPTGSETTATVYGSDWCAGCHQGRLSGGMVLNHPVDSIDVRAHAYSYNNVPLAPWPGVVDIACDTSNGNVFVADPGNGRVQQFTQTGTYTYSQNNYAGKLFLEPRGVAVGANSHLWLADSRSGNLLVYGVAGAWGTWYGNPVLRGLYVAYANPDFYDVTVSGMGTSPDGLSVAIADTEANMVTVRTGAPTASTLQYALKPTAAQGYPNPTPSTLLGEFDSPTDATVSSGGIAYVVDSMNNRIQRFDTSGAVIDSFGSYGSGPGQFDHPLSIALDATGRVYVADSGNHRIQRFSAAGTYETSIGTLGSGNVQFRYPAGVIVNIATGDIYVVDAGNARIQRLDAAGAYLGQWGSLGAGNGQFAFLPVQTGSMAFAPERQYMKGLVYGGRGYVMQVPRSAAQSGHGPICQQCHEDSRNAGALYDGVAVPAITMSVLDGRQNNPRFITGGGSIGERDKSNPRFQNFPHETTNAKMLVETDDNLCLNCHSPAQLP